MLPGSGIFTAAVKRGVAPHTRKQRVLAAISKLRSAFFTGYKNKIARTIIYNNIYAILNWTDLRVSRSLRSLANYKLLHKVILNLSGAD